MLQLSVSSLSNVLRLDTYDMDAIATNKLCKLNFRYFIMYLDISQQQGYQSFFNNVFINILIISFIDF